MYLVVLVLVLFVMVVLFWVVLTIQIARAMRRRVRQVGRILDRADRNDR